MAELKPCPFCGGKDFRVVFELLMTPKIYKVVCESCCAEGPLELNEQRAIDAWNKRS